MSQSFNNTLIETTNGGPSPSSFYTSTTYIPDTPSLAPTNYPTLEPTWFPTVTGEFPFIRYAQSYIKCGKNIQLQDTQTNDAFAQFIINQPTTLNLSFILCKASQSFHHLDTFRIWQFDEDADSWNYTPVSPKQSNSDCTLFLVSNFNADIQTIYVSLRTYLPYDYGKYTIYMHCNNDLYNPLIAPAPLSPPIYGRINDYIQPIFDESDIHFIGSISCNIIWTQEITQSAFFQKEQYYKFEVNEYLEFIHLTTCNDTNKAHSVTIYYTNGDGQTWTSMTKMSDAESMCTMLDRYYLIPGVYYLSLDISNMLYSHYTLAMFCSDSNAIKQVTEYEKYVPPTIKPTQISPINGILTTELKVGGDGKNDDSAMNVIGLSVSLIIVALLLMGIVFGYRKYKKRANKKDKLRDVKVEMIANSSGCFNDNVDKKDEESEDSSDSNTDCLVKESVEKITGHETQSMCNDNQEGEIEGEGKMENKDDSDSGDNENSDEDIAAPAFANMNFEVEPPPVHIPGHIEMNVHIAPTIPTMIDEDNTIAMEENEEEKIEELPKEQMEFMIGSYCYVDCDTVYGVNGKHQKNHYLSYKILPIWERQRNGIKNTKRASVKKAAVQGDCSVVE